MRRRERERERERVQVLHSHATPYFLQSFFEKFGKKEIKIGQAHSFGPSPSILFKTSVLFGQIVEE